MLASIASRINLPLLLLTVVVLAIFFRLGLWQLDRAAEKNSMLQEAQAAAAVPTKNSLANVQPERHLYHKYRLSGRFDFSRQLLLDNKIFGGQAGYEIITPFYPHETPDSAVLVNRGWVAADPDRRVLPELATDIVEPLAINVLLTLPSKGFASGQAFADEQTGWPRRVQFVDYSAIAQRLETSLAVNAMFVAEDGQAGVLQYNFQPVANGPEKHYGYAFQWFAMFLALLVIYVYYSFFRNNASSQVQNAQ